MLNINTWITYFRNGTNVQSFRNYAGSLVSMSLDPMSRCGTTTMYEGRHYTGWRSNQSHYSVIHPHINSWPHSILIVIVIIVIIIIAILCTFRLFVLDSISAVVCLSSSICIYIGMRGIRSCYWESNFLLLAKDCNGGPLRLLTSAVDETKHSIHNTSISRWNSIALHHSLRPLRKCMDYSLGI